MANTNIEGVYTTPPSKITEPRFSYKISVANSQSLDDDVHHDNEILQKRMHVILCYKKQSNEDPGLHVGGWFKESLGNALMEHPILAGRLRRSENGGFEIVSNDGGVRCVEAQMPLSLVDFLESKEKKNEVEGKLVYWKDVEESNPQFSPLIYIQVTKFQCGGYSVGISYSLLLIDPSSMAKFLNRWAEIHRSIPCQSEIPRTPLFNVSNLRQSGYSSLEDATTHIWKTSKTMIFNISTTENIHSGDEICKHYMLLCLEKAENKYGNKMSSTFTLITKGPNGDTKVENLSKENNYASLKNLRYELNSFSWEDLRTDEIAFHKANGAVDASNWISCDALGVVVVVLSCVNNGEYDIKVYITLPSK